MRFTSLIIALGLGASAVAQTTPAPATPAAPSSPALTPEQVANVLKQLEDIEKTVMTQRGTSLGSIIQRLRSACSSDAAAINLLAECDTLVNVERKDGDRDDKKRIEQRKEAAKRNERTEDTKKTGDKATGLRLELEYLALTLEAHDAKDLATMIPKINAFHQMLLSQAKDLKGGTGDALMRSLLGGGGARGGVGSMNIGVVIEAFSLEPFMRREGWSLTPGDVIGMYDRVIIKKARDKKKEDIGPLWDTAITLDASIRKLRMFEKEFVLWEQTEYPDLKWQRAVDLATNGVNPVAGMGEMMKVIKDNPNSPSSPTWIKTLRDMVKPVSDPAADPAAADSTK